MPGVDLKVSEFAAMWLQMPPHEVIRVHPWEDEVRLWLTETGEGMTLTGAAARYYKTWWDLHQSPSERKSL